MYQQRVFFSFKKSRDADVPRGVFGCIINFKYLCFFVLVFIKRTQAALSGGYF